MAKTLSAGKLIEQAVAETGLQDFGSESYREGLDILVADFNNRADERSEAGFQIADEVWTDYLKRRLGIVDYLATRPELEQRPIERPVFVFGIPRTGTTLLNNLLAADPARRSPLTWEIEEPLPPPTADTLYNDPRALAALEAERALLTAHPEAGQLYRSSAVYPNEDVWIMASDFKTIMLETRGKLPAYREWIFSTDVTSAYEFHKKWLQVHQSEAPGIWNLKMPSHAYNIETLLKVYPDARLIWTHRDPLTAVGSFCSIITMGHSRFENKVDSHWIGEDCHWQAVEHQRRAQASRDKIGHDRILDVSYANLTRDPIGTMRELYAGLGDEFTPEAEASMQSWLDDNPQHKFGKHEYKLNQFGLDMDVLKKDFADYVAEYQIEPEG